MLFQQFVDDDLGCASYLVGDEDAGVAAIVDPPYAIEPVLAEAAKRGVRIVRTVETHTHADHLSGHGRLALEQGVPISIHPAAEAVYEHDPLDDGTEIVLGEVVLRAIHTPGHRPEHTCIAVSDRSRAEEPWLVLTGDSLFVGDTAPARSRDRCEGGRRGSLPLAAAPARARRRCRGLPRPRRRLAVRQGDELEGVLDDRLRAALQRRAPDRARGGLRHRIGVGLGAEAAEHDPAGGAEPRAARRRRRCRPRAAGGARRSDGARRPPRPRLSRGPCPRSAERAGLGKLVRDQGRVPARSRGADRRPGGERARGRARRSWAALDRLPRAGRIRPRRRAGADRGGRPGRARRAAEGRRRADRRARARRARRRLHRRQPQHPLSAPARRRRGCADRPADRDDLRERRTRRASPRRSSPRGESTPVRSSTAASAPGRLAAARWSSSAAAARERAAADRARALHRRRRTA